MSEMVCRVARAIAEYWERVGFDPSEPSEGAARAAIEAMREPTKAMGAAGLIASSHDPLGGNEKMTSEAAEKIGWTDRLRANPVLWEMPVWRAMIDEALK